PGKFYSTVITQGVPCLILEASPGTWTQNSSGAWVYLPNESTNWYGNLRLGDRIIINHGRPYTICGPFAVQDSGGYIAEDTQDMCVQAAVPLIQTYVAPDGVTTAQAI